MRIEMLSDISGRNPHTGKVWPRSGSEVDVPDAVAVKMINAGLAKHTRKNEEAVEKAVAEAVIETANRRPRGRPVGTTKKGKAKG
jgi:hypothetical protein